MPLASAGVYLLQLGRRMSTVTLAPPARPVAGSRARTRPARAVLAAFAWLTAGSHLVLTPRYLSDGVAFGATRLAVALFLLAIAWGLLHHPAAPAPRAAGVGSLVLIAAWIVVRAVAPPLSDRGGPQPVSLPEVVSRGAELATLLVLAVLASGLRLPAGRSWHARWAWGTAAAVTFALLFLLSSTAFRIVPWTTKSVPAFNVYGSGFSLGSPFLIGMLLPHLWVVGSWSTFALTGLAAVMVGANVASAMRRDAQGSCASRRREVLAVTPTIFAVSACCGTPAALFLSTAAIGLLLRATPWILAGTILLLAANLVLMRRSRRPREGPVEYARPGATKMADI